MFEKITLICEAQTDDLTELARLIAPEDRAFLRGAKLDGLDLRGKDLRGFDLTGTSYDGIQVDDGTRVDPSFDYMLPEKEQATQRKPRRKGQNHFEKAAAAITSQASGNIKKLLIAALKDSACLDDGFAQTCVRPDEPDRCYSADELSRKHNLPTDLLLEYGVIVSKAMAYEHLLYAGVNMVERSFRRKAYLNKFGRIVSRTHGGKGKNVFSYAEIAVIADVELSFALPSGLEHQPPTIEPRQIFQPLGNQGVLIDRKDERLRLHASIRDNEITAVIGERGVGKTSLGMAVLHSMNEATPTGNDFFDAIWVSAARGSIYDAILQRLVEIERDDNRTNVSPAFAQAVKGSVSNLLKRDGLITSQAQATSFMREVITKLVRSLPRRLVIFVDDFDAADEGEQSAIVALRDLGIGVCIFSTSPNHIEREVWHSISERNGSLLRLEGLSRSDFQEIYTRANASLRDADVSVRFSTSFIDTAWHYSGGMPYLAQLIGMSALEDWFDKGTGKPELVDKDARSALPSILHRLDFSRAGRDGGILRNLSSETLAVLWTIAREQETEFETDRVLKDSGSTTIQADLKALAESGYLFDEHGKLRFADNNARLQILMLYEQEKGHLPKGESDKQADLF